jgi:hypothetical protein
MKNHYLEHRHLIFAVLGIAMGFVFGFRMANKSEPLALQYNTPIIPYEQTLKSTKEEPKKDGVVTQVEVVSSSKDKIETEGKCAIKGNSTSKIYHIPGGAFYERMKSPTCFRTEEEAKKAGFRRSSR